MFNWWRKLAHLRHIRTEGLLTELFFLFFFFFFFFLVLVLVLKFYSIDESYKFVLAIFVSQKKKKIVSAFLFWAF